MLIFRFFRWQFLQFGQVESSFSHMKKTILKKQSVLGWTGCIALLAARSAVCAELTAWPPSEPIIPQVRSHTTNTPAVHTTFVKDFPAQPFRTSGVSLGCSPQPRSAGLSPRPWSSLEIEIREDHLQLRGVSTTPPTGLREPRRIGDSTAFYRPSSELVRFKPTEFDLRMNAARSLDSSVREPAFFTRFRMEEQQRSLFRDFRAQTGSLPQIFGPRRTK